jgi:hypothetical protein
LWSVSHPANYYISNTWEAGIDGVYRWRIKSNHSDLASVAWSDNTYSMAGLPYTQWARSDVWYADGGDFNNCIDHSGISSISAIANTPFGSGWYTLYNARHRGGISDGNVWGSQITIGMTAYENRIAFRNHYNNTWRAWTELWTTANLNNTTDFKLHTLALGGVNDYDTNETPSLGALTNKLRTYNNGDSSFGFGVSINSQNYSVPTDMRHRFWVGGTEKMSIRQNDIYMNPNGGDGITFSGDNGFINRIYANQSSSSWLMLTSGGAEIELRGTNNDERITFNGKSRFYNDVIIDGDLNLPYGNITCPNTTTYFGSMTTPYPDSGQSYSISGGGIYSSIVTNVGAGYLNGVSFGSGRLTFQHEGYYIVWYSMSVSSNANTFAKTRIRAFYPDNSTAYGMEGFVDVNGSTARTISVTSILYMPAGTQLNLQGTLNVAGTLYVYNYQFHAVRISYQL